MYSWGVLCAGLILFAGTRGSAAPLYPYLADVRTEITNQLAFVSDTNNAVIGSRSAQIRLLTQARNLISRRGRSSLQGDLQLLATVSALLSRTGTNNLFAPLLDEAMQNYATVLTENSGTLAATLTTLPPSPSVTAAMDNLDAINGVLDQASTAATPALASRLLSRASLRLIALQTVVTRLTRVPDPTPPPAGVNEFRAFINGETFVADTVPLATFSPGTGFLTLRAAQNLGGETRSMSLTMSGVRDGRTTVIQFGNVLQGNYAIYTRSGSNTVGYTSTSGSATVTLDATNHTVSGSFNFIGTSQAGLAAPVQVSGGTFTANVR